MTGQSGNLALQDRRKQQVFLGRHLHVQAVAQCDQRLGQAQGRFVMIAMDDFHPVRQRDQEVQFLAMGDVVTVDDMLDQRGRVRRGIPAGLVDQALQPRGQGRQIQPRLVCGLAQAQVAAAAEADTGLAKDAGRAGQFGGNVGHGVAGGKKGVGHAFSPMGSGVQARAGGRAGCSRSTARAAIRAVMSARLAGRR